MVFDFTGLLFDTASETSEMNDDDVSFGFTIRGSGGPPLYSSYKVSQTPGGTST